MGIFDKVAQKTANVGKSVAGSAAKVGSSVVSTTQEQTELVQLKSKVNVIEQELCASYTIIGRKFVEYVIETGEMPGIDISDLIPVIEPKLANKKEIEDDIIKLEKEIKDKSVLREKQQAEEDFLKEKAKLDKALAMDVISQDEYDSKLSVLQKKLDSFEEIRKIEKQYDMKLITKEEKEAKLKALLGE